MHFLATNTICTFKDQMAVIISPITYNKVLIQTINKERVEVNTKRLVSLKNDKLIKIEINGNSSVDEVNKELMKVYGEYQKLTEESKTETPQTDFERFKMNLKKKVEEEILKSL